MAARSAPPEPSAVTVTVTAVGKKDAASRTVKRDDVQLYQGKERKQVADWRRGETLFLAVLIDQMHLNQYLLAVSPPRNHPSQL